MVSLFGKLHLFNQLNDSSIVVIWAVALGAMASLNLHRMRKRRGHFKLSLPECAMIFEIVVDISTTFFSLFLILTVRILTIIDPASQRTPGTFFLALVFIQEFIIQTVQFAVLLYWQKALSKSAMRPSAWKSMKKLGISVFVIWIALLLIVVIFLAVNPFWAAACFIFEILIAQIIVIGLVVASLRILQLLRKNPDTKQRSKDKVKFYTLNTVFSIFSVDENWQAGSIIHIDNTIVCCYYDSWFLCYE